MILSGNGDPNRSDVNYTVRNNDFMDAVRAADQECERLTLPSIAVGAGLAALFIFGTVMAIVTIG